jgi:hypothetical protein
VRISSRPWARFRVIEEVVDPCVGGESVGSVVPSGGVSDGAATYF